MHLIQSLKNEFCFDLTMFSKYPATSINSYFYKMTLSILVLKEILKQALFKLQMIDEPNCIESNFLHLPLDFVNQALNLIFSIISFHPALCQH